MVNYVHGNDCSQSSHFPISPLLPFQPWIRLIRIHFKVPSVMFTNFDTESIFLLKILIEHAPHFISLLGRTKIWSSVKKARGYQGKSERMRAAGTIIQL